MPASESLSHLELLRHDSRELLLQGGDSTPDLRHEIRPELLDAATPLSRSRRGSFSRRQTLRRNSSMPREMHRQPKYITPGSLPVRLCAFCWYGDIQVLRNTFPGSFTPTHPPSHNDIKAFFREISQPALRYVTLEWPLYQCTTFFSSDGTYRRTVYKNRYFHFESYQPLWRDGHITRYNSF